MLEVKEAVSSVKDSISAGPDGFNSRFFKIRWSKLKGELCDMVQSVFEEGMIIGESNHSLICLIPKSDDPKDISDFRPISCCNFVYKIIAKILANRLNLLMDNLISENQFAFVKGRNISDGILLAHELARGFNRASNSNMCIKIDLRKAYDSINRKFVIHMMVAMGFSAKWLAVIEEMINSPSFSIQLHGSHGFFGSSNGLRQGDPISPLLFAIVMEYFCILMERKCREHRLKATEVGSSFLSHIIYADDILIFCKAEVKAAEAIREVFSEFYAASGMKLNEEKSAIFFGKGCGRREDICRRLNIPEGPLPIKYLGLPLSAVNIKHENCSKLVQQIKRRMEGWEARMLSLAGRLELISSTVYPIVQFWMQVFKLPIATVNAITRLCSDFLWNSRVSKISWSVVCKPKSEGGLGLRDFNLLQKGLGIKLLWRIIRQKGLWANFMSQNYVKGQSVWECPIRSDLSGVWKFILDCRNEGLQLFRKRIVDGKSTSLWFDPWLSGGSILNRLGVQTMMLVRGEKLNVDRIIHNNSWRVDRLSYLAGMKSEIENSLAYKF